MSIRQSYQGLAIAFVLLVIFPAILAVTFFLYMFLLSILPFQLPPEVQIYLGLFIIVVVFIKPVQFLMKLVNTRFEDEPDDSPTDAQRLPGAESNGSAPGALGANLDEPLTLRQKLETLPAHPAYQILAHALLLLIIVPVIGTLTGSFFVFVRQLFPPEAPWLVPFGVYMVVMAFLLPKLYRLFHDLLRLKRL